MTAICHCTDCQRQTGSIGSVLVAVPAPALEITGSTLSSYKTVGEDRGTPADRRFCSACGSPIVSFVPETPDLAYIKAGTLDDTSWLQPQIELWGRSAQPWLAPVEGRPRLDRGP